MFNFCPISSSILTELFSSRFVMIITMVMVMVMMHDDDVHVADDVIGLYTQVTLEEAKESYADEIVHEIQSKTAEDMTLNATRIQQWIAQWQV